MKRAFIVFILLSIASGCGRVMEPTFIDVEAVTTPLIDGFESYASAAQVKDRVLSGMRWRTATDSHLFPGDRRPPYNILALSLEPFSHLGQTGELELFFFNDRLMSTWFYPSNPMAYLEAVRRAGILPRDRDTWTGTYTRIRTYTDWQGRVYVAWEDIRLTIEQEQWIMRYS